MTDAVELAMAAVDVTREEMLSAAVDATRAMGRVALLHDAASRHAADEAVQALERSACRFAAAVSRAVHLDRTVGEGREDLVEATRDVSDVSDVSTRSVSTEDVS